eukprot:2062499-Amphidinium_carterae.2
MGRPLALGAGEAGENTEVDSDSNRQAMSPNSVARQQTTLSHLNPSSPRQYNMVESVALVAGMLPVSASSEQDARTEIQAYRNRLHETEQNESNLHAGYLATLRNLEGNVSQHVRQEISQMRHGTGMFSTTYASSDAAARMESLQLLQTCMKPASTFKAALETLRSWNHNLRTRPEPMVLLAAIVPLFDELLRESMPFGVRALEGELYQRCMEEELNKK